MSLRVSIPSFRKVKDEEDSYTAFLVDVWVSGSHHVIEKRYSEFEELHKQLKKLMKTPEFPPKKVLKWNTKVLEQRRYGLDAYLQGILEHHTVPAALHIFLETDALGANIDFSKEEEEQEKPTHQPIVTINADAYQNICKGSLLPDIVSEGVNMGLFSSQTLDLR